MQVSAIEVVQRVADSDPYPVQLKEHGVDFLLDQRHLWIRTPRQASILRIRAEAERAARNYMDAQGYTLTDTPIFTPAACEGTTTLFEVDYIDDQKAYLTQSGQLYVEATAAALGKVYSFGPTFRAEKSKTRRHLTEFWMLEPEAAYAHLEDMIQLGEGLVSAVVQSVVKNRARELAALQRDAAQLEKITPPFPRISYDEAIAVLQKAGNPAKWGDDFGGDEETIISREFEKPVIIHRYPTAMKAFYMATDAQRPELSLSFDMIAPEGYGEIIGGGERQSNYETLVRRIREHGLPEESFQWYLDLRRYGSVPHAGFGLGLERTVAWICGTEHIREVIPFPRMLYRVYP
jgi:asparaginyl-tRNA synthetase